MDTIVVKTSGEKELFSEKKVLHSMQRVGLPQDLQPMVLEHIKSKLYPNIPTSEIYSHIIEFLGQKDPKASVRFNLKKSILDLGPTGFPFEKYMARIFQALGYTTAVDVIMQGECVSHEIDIVLEKNGERHIVEAKFHQMPGSKTDIHVPLYMHSRFLDVSSRNGISKVWIVTNTKLSADAIAYSICKGIPVIAWNYPEKGNLQEFVEDPQLYPITILNHLNHQEKTKLLADNIVLTCDLVDKNDNDIIKNYGVDKARLDAAKKQAQLICNKRKK